MKVKRIAFIHMDAKAGNLEENKNTIEKALELAAQEKVDWVITPELATTGYTFETIIGAGWVKEQPDGWVKKLFGKASKSGITFFLGCPEKDKESGILHNSVFVSSPSGGVLGKHRKITVQISSEEWSKAGSEKEVIEVDGVKVGILICADTWYSNIAEELKQKGAQLLISPACWPPKPCGPEGCWEKRSFETSLPLWLCNRTGEEKTLSFLDGESVVIKNGERCFSATAKESTLMVFDWDMENMAPISTEFKLLPIKTG